MSLHGDEKFAQRYVCFLARVRERIVERETCMMASAIGVLDGRLAR